MPNNLVRKIRKSRKMSQEELAKRSYVSRTYITLIEIGKRTNPSRDIMLSISLALEKTVAEVFFPDSHDYNN